MKNFLRISIVVLVLIGLGFATYAVFFKPANKDEVYLTLTQVNEIEKELKYDVAKQSILELPSKGDMDNNAYVDMLNKYNTHAKDKVDAAINSYGKFVLDNKSLMSIDSYSYPQIKDCMDEVFNYYYAYSQAVNKTIPKSVVKKIKTSVNNYRDSLNELIIKGYNEVKSLQNYIWNNPTQNVTQELENRFKNATYLYRRHINVYADLIDEVKNFVVKYTFNDELITDRESLLYDLMILSIKKAVSGEYSFSDTSVRNVADDYMKSAINFISLAMKDDTGKKDFLEKTYKYLGDSIEYNGKLYASHTLNYSLVEDLEFRVEKNGNYATLFIGDSDVVVADSISQLVEIDNVGYVTINANNANGNIEIGKQSIVDTNKVYFDCYVDINEPNKLFFYNGEYSHLENNRQWIDLIKPVGLSGSQLVFTDIANDAVKSSVTCVLKKEVYYPISISSNEYNYKIEVDSQTQNVTIVSIGDGVELKGAKYHAYNFYSTTYLKDSSNNSAGESLNYKKMIKCYNKIMSDSAGDLSRMIDLSYDQKVAFVENELVNGVNIRASFVEVLHSDMEYLLACCGFVGGTK